MSRGHERSERTFAAEPAGSRMKVVIVGGGWAGLSAAVELGRHDVPALILESARQLGGRARALRFGRYHVDNGQHILLGAFRSVLDILDTLGVSEASVFRRQPLRVLLLGEGGERVEIKTSRLPAPLHLAAGLLRTRSLSLQSRLRAFRLLRFIRRTGFSIAHDRSVMDFLLEHKQTSEALRILWRPLCLSALNTPPENASARLFLRVVRETFFGGRHHSELLLPILDLSACLPRPAMDFIESRGGAVRLNARVQALEIENGAVTGVHVGEERVPADHVIVATPPEACAALLGTHAPLSGLVASFRQLRPQSICTVFLRYPESVTLERDMIGLLDALPHWLFDRGRLTGDRGLIAAVVNGPGAHLRWSNEALIEQVVEDLARRFPSWPPPLETKLIRERRATLAGTIDVDRFRPAHATPIRGLWIAGDYTATGYPSSLEGAVRSGMHCARWIMRHAQTSNTLYR